MQLIDVREAPRSCGPTRCEIQAGGKGKGWSPIGQKNPAFFELSWVGAPNPMQCVRSRQCPFSVQSRGDALRQLARTIDHCRIILHSR
jgi:hypothetical protein